MIYTRYTYTTENLTVDDFKSGYGFNSSLYLEVVKKRKDGKLHRSMNYYHENSYAIDGSFRKKAYHPLLNHILIRTNEDGTEEELIIESVHRHWHIGYYWMLIYRKEGTKSHGQLMYKNENCICDWLIESIEETKKEVRFKNKNLSWKMY
jgi:hypothetical protein